MIPGSANPLLLASAQAATAYNIERSVRLNSADSAYLSRTPSVAGNRTAWSFSAWVKRSKLGTQQTIFIAGETYAAGSGDNYATGLAFGADNKLYSYWRSSFAPLAGSLGVYRDASAWYHVVCAANGSTLKSYVNSIEVSSGAISGNGAVSSTLVHLIGAAGTSTYFAYGDLYLADIHFIDGQALDPTSFGEFDANGVWQPKAYIGTYPGNSFHLPFSDNSTAAALGTDTSGNGNTWTVNNISVAAGAGNDSLVDTPSSTGTDTGAGGEVRGNYATLNPLDGSPTGLSNGNLDAASANAYPTIIPGSGQWYYEVNGTGYQWDGTRANWTPRAGSHNFGQRTWASSAPSGYKALCTTNLPEPQTITTSGSYTGNGVADGPFVYLNGVPTAMTVNGTAVTFGTHADKLSNGFKLRTTSTTYNQNAATYNYSVTSTGPTFKTARAQAN